MEFIIEISQYQDVKVELERVFFVKGWDFCG